MFIRAIAELSMFVYVLESGLGILTLGLVVLMLTFALNFVTVVLLWPFKNPTTNLAWLALGLCRASHHLLFMGTMSLLCLFFSLSPSHR